MIGFLLVHKQFADNPGSKGVWVNPEAVDHFESITEMQRRGNLFLSMRNGTTLYLLETEEEFLAMLERVSEPPKCGAPHPDSAFAFCTKRPGHPYRPGATEAAFLHGYAGTFW